EVPLYTYALNEVNFSRSKRVAVAFGASTITHPIVWFVFPALIPDSYVKMVIACETFAVMVEAAYMRIFGLRRYFSWSLLANALSFCLSILSRNVIGWP
ncbi:MAG TPA: hypothetical protein VFG09_08650, partial [Thermodesulfovibrionales bacterium]|nr:hypothetical protein [Thermodesulfovibrionales bacterium]